MPARIVVGYHFILVSWPKVFTGFPGETLAKPVVLMNFRQRTRLVYLAIMQIAVGYYFLMLGWPRLPEPIGYAEVAIGMSLLAGLVVRIGAAAATLHSLNLYLTATANAVVGLNRLLIVLNLAFVAASAGRSVGVDAWLRRKFPRNPLF